MDLKNWYENNSFLYRNIELKGAFLTELYTEEISNKKRSLLYYFLRNMKWKILSHIKKNDYYTDNIRNIRGLNAYVINFEPEDYRHFDHTKYLIEQDSKSLILTTNIKVYNFYKGFRPVVLFDVKFQNPYFNKNEYFEKVKTSKKYNVIRNRAINLIDLLTVFDKKYGMPNRIITLQDFHMYDYVFTQFYKNKITTITLQHGMITEGVLWNFVFSDYIIVWGEKPKNKLTKFGIPSEKIKAIGTAKYDGYLKREKIQRRKNNRILFSIQPHLSKEYLKEIIIFITGFINKSNHNIYIRYHPAVNKITRKALYKSFKKDKLINRRVFISNEVDPIKDLVNSDILLASQTSLAVEAMLFETIVIEYLSDKNKIYEDYRDIVPHFKNPEDLITFIDNIYKDKEFKNAIVKYQSKYIDKEIKKPPRAKKILDFINEV